MLRITNITIKEERTRQTNANGVVCCYSSSQMSKASIRVSKYRTDYLAFLSSTSTENTKIEYDMQINYFYQNQDAKTSCCCCCGRQRAAAAEGS